jgi:hypothetical protein
MSFSVNTYLKAPRAIQINGHQCAKDQCSHLPMIIDTDYLLEAAFLYNDFKSMYHQRMVCCILLIDKSRSDDFQKFQVEGLPNLPTRRSLVECTKVILDIARKIIDVKFKDSQEMRNINEQRAYVPHIIENSRNMAASQGIKLSSIDEFIVFSSIEFSEILYQFEPYFEPKGS